MITPDRVAEIWDEVYGYGREVSEAADEAEAQGFDQCAEYLRRVWAALDYASGVLADAEVPA